MGLFLGILQLLVLLGIGVMSVALVVYSFLEEVWFGVFLGLLGTIGYACFLYDGLVGF